ncbi:MAG: aspartate kinase [Pelagibacteraceae bacterium]|jgi:aspartate kinase|nr:aspartate kinase [Pelagibacteraceae bacterium]HJO14411.1 aspartate kinase [Alphaproteobacteria bacterium]MBO6466988.1 aspartate kinase [Pelagibacteraceae bacterium]MBO6467982.1 aspartate kinase [Pelagibacteraceae bacterium]MBO6468983.1 aspartate kinase [Pelagibacteraceae bacterium]|tara:strand:- start:869 stop:2086 length:1218 start_codon:yes stop_codon:yes gene_type:complete
MKIVVMKFGGTSVANINRIKNVASIINKNYKKYKLVIVLSAMAGVTNDLQKLIDQIDYPSSKENDLVLTSGEQVTVGLLSMILNKMKIKSIPLLGWQVPIITDSSHEKAKILNINKDNILKYLDENDVVVLAGFQGINTEGKITSIGRGGSDTTAVAIASSLNAERCDIFTDVDGVYSGDPTIVKSAKKIDKFSYEEMLEMSSMGAKVLHTRSVELAMKNNLTLQVLSSLINQEGTFIVNEKKLIEKEVVSGVSYSKDESKITISGIPDKPGIAAKIFRILSRNNINIDMIVQNISQDGISANLTFTVLNKDMKISKNLLEKNSEGILYKQLSTNSEVAKISVIGMGMMSQSGVAEKMFQTLADQKINILAISTSEIKISVLIEEKYTNNAVNSLHSAYRLGINN